MYPETFRDQYIEAYIKLGFSRIKACKQVGIHYNTHKLWMEDPVFKKKFDEAVEEALVTLIEEAEGTHRVLRLGIPRKDKSGNLKGWKERPDARGIEWFLSRTEPKYNDKIKVEHSGDISFSEVIKEMLKDGITADKTDTKTTVSNSDDS